MDTIGARLRAAIKSARFKSHREAAHAAGVSGATLSDWANNKVLEHKASTAEQIAKALNITVPWLLHGKGDMHPTTAPHCVTDETAPYTPDPRLAELNRVFPRLTRRQQDALLAQARELARENAAILAELCPSQTSAPR